MTQFALPQIDSGISALNVQEVYIQRGLPVVITQLASQWPITAACSLEKLRYTHGGVEVSYCILSKPLECMHATGNQPGPIPYVPRCMSRGQTAAHGPRWV